MALCIPKREVEPGTKWFKPLWCAKYLTNRINEFEHPAALICWFRTPKVQARLNALPDKWRFELKCRYTNRLDALNERGGL